MRSLHDISVPDDDDDDDDDIYALVYSYQIPCSNKNLLRVVKQINARIRYSHLC